MIAEDVLLEFLEQVRRVPRCEFDRIAACDYSLFASFPRWTPPDVRGRPFESVAGIPIVVDEALPSNTLELRDGERVVRRLEFPATVT